MDRAQGSDQISAELLNMFCVEAVIHSQCLFKMFLRFGYSPSKLMKVKQCHIPIDKIGDLPNLNNYRCIAISSCILKLFELFLLKHTLSVIELSDCQFNFRRNHLTQVHALPKKVAFNYVTVESYSTSCCVRMCTTFRSWDPQTAHTIPIGHELSLLFIDDI